MRAKHKLSGPQVLCDLLQGYYEGEIEGRQALVLLLAPKQAVSIPVPRPMVTTSHLGRIICCRRVTGQSSVVVGPVTFQEAPDKCGDQRVIEESLG